MRIISNQKGFTLLELLAVIAIIGILTAIIMSSVSAANAKARDTRRKRELMEVRTALALYFSTNGNYPSTGGSNNWRGAGATNSVCTNFNNSGTYNTTNYVPSLTPSYIAVLPADPKPKNTTDSCYVYTSDGTDYKFIAHNTPENPSTGGQFIDANPTRASYAWAIWSQGASGW